MSVELSSHIEPPKFLTESGKKKFRDLEYRVQCFIYYKYVSRLPKGEIMRKLFMKSRDTYRKYNFIVKDFMIECAEYTPSTKIRH